MIFHSEADGVQPFNTNIYNINAFCVGLLDGVQADKSLGQKIASRLNVRPNY